MQKGGREKRRQSWLAVNILGVFLVASVLAVGFGIWYRAQQSKVATVATPLSHERFEAVSAKLTELMNKQDPKSSFAYLRSLVAKDPSVAHDCHPLLHHLGRAAYQKYGTFSQAVVYQDSLCNSGYTHGALEAYFLASPDVQQALQTACAGMGDTTFQAWQCYHGTGHGVMFVTGKDLHKSLVLCQEHATTFAQKSCVNGVFMERFIVVSHMGGAVPNADAIQISLCQSQPEVYKPDCYLYATTAYLTRHPSAYGGAFRECEQQAGAYQASCAEGVGSQAMKDNITRPDVARTVCEKAPRAYRMSCVEGAVGILVNNYGSTKPVAPLCKTVFSRYEDQCKQIVSSKLQFTQFE